jgi:hypothetical protein
MPCNHVLLKGAVSSLGDWQGGKGYCVPYEPDANGSLPDCAPGWVCHPPTCDRTGAQCSAGYSCAGAVELYVYSLYFAIMTITSVGYGDISASPFMMGEQIVCAVIMLGTALLWGNLIGVFCSLAATSPSTREFREELSQLNTFMAAYDLAPSLRFRLREFIHETVHLRDVEARSSLLAKLSPAMQGEVSLMVNSRWVAKVWYLKDGAELELLIEIASRLKPQVFAPWEFVPGGAMYVLQRGVAIWGAKIQNPGSAFGTDVLLENRSLQLGFLAIATRYVWVLVIDGRGLMSAVSKFPASTERLLKMARKWTIRRAIVRAAERECHKRGVDFFGRRYPLYAKELVQKMRLPRKSLVAPNKHKKSSLLRAMTTSLEFGAEASWRKRIIGEGSGSRSGGASLGGQSSTSGSANSLSKLAAQIKTSNRFVSRLGNAPKQAKAKHVDSSEMKAAANFGLQLGEERLNASSEVSTEDKLQALSNEVKELKASMMSSHANLEEKLNMLLGQRQPIPSSVAAT